MSFTDLVRSNKKKLLAVLLVAAISVALWISIETMRRVVAPLSYAGPEKYVDANGVCEEPTTQDSDIYFVGCGGLF